MDEHRPDPAEESTPDHTAAGENDSAPLGGHETTEEQLEADNEVEEDAIKALNPDDSPA